MSLRSIYQQSVDVYSYYSSSFSFTTAVSLLIIHIFSLFHHYCVYIVISHPTFVYYSSVLVVLIKLSFFNHYSVLFLLLNLSLLYQYSVVTDIIQPFFYFLLRIGFYFYYWTVHCFAKSLWILLLLILSLFYHGSIFIVTTLSMFYH